jgi:site-specific recombinase XerD
MGVIKPTFAITQDTRKETKDGHFPLKLRVTFNRITRLYGISKELTEEQYLKLYSSKLRDEKLKDVRFYCDVIKQKAEEVSEEIETFTFEKFKEAFFVNHNEEAQAKDVYKNIEIYINQLKEEGRASTASSYQCTLNSLKKFKKKLTFDEITGKFLNDYEKWMINSGKSSTTVGIYLRSLRTIFNQAIDKGIINKDIYPFKKKIFQIAAGRNIKKALTLQEVEMIFKYETITGTAEDKAKDFWIFSYLCNGLNVKDIARLKFKDIQKETIILVRAKTERTSKSNQKQIVIPITERSKEIIEKWKNEIQTPDIYVFPILEPKITPLRERELIQNFTKLINKYMKRIGVSLGFDKNLTTYVARHSFSTVLKRSGVSIEYISEALGHQNLKTTESYLDSFEESKKREYANLLTKFD